MCVAGHVARYAGTQFGHKVSHGPLWAITQTVCSYASRNHRVDMGEFVDDLLKSMATPVHPACRGLVGRCQICLKAQEAAQVKMQFLDRMMRDCGLEFSVKGDMSIRQDHIFIGIVFDVLRGRLLITKDKFEKTMILLREIMEQAELSPRGMAKLRGKFGHQFRCVEGVAVLLVPFNNFIGGPESAREWDEAKPIPHHLRDNMGQLFKWLPKL